MGSLLLNGAHAHDQSPDSSTPARINLHAFPTPRPLRRLVQRCVMARGGIVTNINYNDICIRNSGQALLFTPYYSTKALSNPTSPLYPDFHDITLSNVHIIGTTSAIFEGFQANTGGIAHAALPLGMTLTNVLADSPGNVAVTTSDANLTLNNVNLPIFPSNANRVVLTGAASQSLSTANAVDCSSAHVDFPGIGDSSPSGQTWAGSQ